MKKGNTLRKPKKKFVVFMEKMLTRQTAANWFRRFQNENFDVKDALRSGLMGKMKSSKKLKKIVV